MVYKAFKNGSQVFNKPRTDNTNYNVNGSSFYFHGMEVVVMHLTGPLLR